MKDAAEAGFFHMRPSYRFTFQNLWGKMTSLLKKTLLISFGLAATLLIFIFIFGSLDPLDRTIVRTPQFTRHESLPVPAPVLSQENITQKIAKQVAFELAEQNPDGPRAGLDGQEIAAADPEELAQKALEKAFSELKIEDLRPVIADKEIIIIKSSEPETEEAYFNSIYKILLTNFPATLDINKADPSKTDFAAFDLAFSKSLDEIRATGVPYMLTHHQKDILSLLTALRGVFALIKNYQNDPFQAAVAVEAGDQFGAELAKVSDEMNAYMKSRNLHLSL